MKAPRMTTNRLYFACLLLLLAGSVQAQYEMPPAQVDVVTAEIRQLAATLDAPGSVVSLADARISAETEGVLRSVLQVGDQVVAGDILAQLDSRLLEVAVTQAQAAVDRLQAELVWRERELERNQGLAASKSGSESLLDESLAWRDRVKHQLTDAQAQLTRAEGDLARASIRAPFAGHVVERLATPGEYLTLGEDVVRLVSTGRIEISVPAPIHLARFVAVGAELEVSSDGRRRTHAVRSVVPVGDAVSRMIEIRLAAGPGDWMVGQPVQVRLPTADPVTAVSVPRDALVQRGGQQLLYRVNSDNTAEQIEADVLVTVGSRVAVANIEEGDQIIIRGAERLSPGQSVVVRERP
ncbi:MAG: RND transporter [Lysobacteraceae bacterium]|nr:MAG: RND transporter [Xanthomonadaceae bacterium]